MKNFKRIRVAIYVRVSTKEQAMEGYSVGEQIDRLTKFAEAHDWVIVKIYTDAGHSGADTNRPALQDLIIDVQAGRIDKVLVYKLDRLSRSQKDTLELIENVFLKHTVDFESMSEKLDTGTPHGRAMIGILAAFAQLEREVIKERMSMGMEARMKEGKWRGGATVPFGYDYEPALDKLVINEYESMIVKEMFELYTNGMSMYHISINMEEKGHTYNNGKVDLRTLRYMLKNKTYCGYMRHKNEWLKGNHDAIISDEVFEKAQERLADAKRRYEETGFKNGVAAISTNLGGLLHCAQCGARYAKVKSGSKALGYYYNYSCYSRNKKVKRMVKDPNCKNKYYRMEMLDEIVFDQIKKLAIDPDYMNQIKTDGKKSDEAQRILTIGHQIKSIDQQLSRFMDLYGLGKYDLAALDAKMQPLNDQKLKLQKELTRLKDESNVLTESEVIQLVKSFDEVIEKGDLHERRAIIEALINRIDIDDENITIHWNFA
ncbi:recombinase family protein [Anaerotignum sp.]